MILTLSATPKVRNSLCPLPSLPVLLEVTCGILGGAGHALENGGVLIIYGPFKVPQSPLQPPTGLLLIVSFVGSVTLKYFKISH